MIDWIGIESRYYVQVVNRQPIVIKQGQGCHVWDVDGKEYLDFTAGWAVNNLGHCHPSVTRAVQEQAALLFQTSNQFYTIPQLQLVELLIENSALDRAFVANSGVEANEGAVKLARKYGRLHRDGAFEVITALNSFHGRSLAMSAATGQPNYHEAWKPLPTGFINVPYNDLDALRKATTDRTCAVMLEPVQGEGGVIIPSPDYLRAVRKWCDEQNLLLIFDEIQTGLGRLGSLWGYQRFGVEPDVMTLAKGLGGGVPIGAFLCKEHAHVMEPGDHGSTFGGNALTCAAAHATVQFIIENDISNDALEMGEYMTAGLRRLHSVSDCVTEVRGMGLLLAVEFSDNIARAVVESCNKTGVLLNPVRPNAIRIMPPLTITRQEIDCGLERLERGLKHTLQEDTREN